jgi:5-(carboxyamino)imidazole ribonucleotide synthase
MSSPVVGIIGGGQLARMSLAPATALDLGLRVLAVSADDSAARVWPTVDIGSADDEAVVRRFAAGCDVVTFDHELVPPSLVRDLARDHTVRPGPQALLAAQDKAHQRTRFAELGLRVPAFTVGDMAQAAEFAERRGWPVVVKAPRGGYDGRGVAVASSSDELSAAWKAVGAMVPFLVEEQLPLDREIAVLLARRPSGDIALWPVVDTIQRDGVLVELRVPTEVDAQLATAATDVARTIAEALDVVGVMAVELFVVRDELFVNEIALRPHNSGHWTTEGSTTSQFAQHLRAVLDWPLGSTASTAPAAVTVNLLGGEDGSDPTDRLALALAVPGAHVHLYGKSARPGRKLGHVTVCADERSAARDRAREAVAILRGERGEA